MINKLVTKMNGKSKKPAFVPVENSSVEMPFLDNSDTEVGTSDVEKRIAGLQLQIRLHLQELQGDIWSLFTCCRRNQIINFIDADFEELNQLIRDREHEARDKSITVPNGVPHFISFQNNLEDFSSHIRESWVECPITVSSVIAHYADGEFKECDYCDGEITLTHSDLYQYETTGQRFAMGFCCDLCEFCDECDVIENNIWHCAECDRKMCKQCLPSDMQTNFCANCNLEDG